MNNFLYKIIFLIIIISLQACKTNDESQSDNGSLGYLKGSWVSADPSDIKLIFKENHSVTMIQDNAFELTGRYEKRNKPPTLQPGIQSSLFFQIRDLKPIESVNFLPTDDPFSDVEEETASLSGFLNEEGDIIIIMPSKVPHKHFKKLRTQKRSSP